MQTGKTLAVSIAALVFLGCLPASLSATPRKLHVVGLGAVKRVPYSKTGDPAGAATSEDSLKISPLVVDGVVKEWTAANRMTLPIAASWCGASCASMTNFPERSPELQHALGVAAWSLAAG